MTVITPEVLAERRSAVEAARAAVAADIDLADLATLEAEKRADARRMAENSATVRALRDAERAELAAVEQAKRQAAAVEQHAAAEKAASKVAAAMQAALVASRDRVAGASTAAMVALVALGEAAQAHDELVRTTAERLLTAGLLLEAEGIDFETGATPPRGRSAAVRLGGDEWATVAPAAALLRSVYGGLRAVLGEVPITTRMRHEFDLARVENRTDGLLAGAPLPAAFVAAPLPRANRLSVNDTFSINPERHAAQLEAEKEKRRRKSMFGR